MLRTARVDIWRLAFNLEREMNKMAISTLVIILAAVCKENMPVQEMSLVFKKAQIFQYNMIFEVTVSQLRGPLQTNTIDIKSLGLYPMGFK